MCYAYHPQGLRHSSIGFALLSMMCNATLLICTMSWLPLSRRYLKCRANAGAHSLCTTRMWLVTNFLVVKLVYTLVLWYSLSPGTATCHSCNVFVRCYCNGCHCVSPCVCCGIKSWHSIRAQREPQLTIEIPGRSESLNGCVNCICM